MSPNAGGRVVGFSQGVYTCVHRAQINFGDLTPYLTMPYTLYQGTVYLVHTTNFWFFLYIMMCKGFQLSPFISNYSSLEGSGYRTPELLWCLAPSYTPHLLLRWATPLAKLRHTPFRGREIIKRTQSYQETGREMSTLIRSTQIYTRGAFFPPSSPHLPPPPSFYFPQETR